MATKDAVDVSELLESKSARKVQRPLLYLSCIVMFLDGFDFASLLVIAVFARSEWQLEPSHLGIAFASSQAGVILGSVLFGIAADRYGRRPIILTVVICFGVLSLCTAFVSSFVQLLILRTATALAIGGLKTVLTALNQEYAPSRSRGTAVAIMFSGYGVGAIAASVFAAVFCTDENWRIIFIVGGVAPLVIVPILWWKLPESLRFLTRSGRRSSAIKIIKTMVPEIRLGPATELIITDEQERQRTGGWSLRLVLARDLRTVSILIWSILFFNQLSLHLISSWIPLFAAEGGASAQQAAMALGVFTMSGVIAAPILMKMVDIRGPALIIIMPIGAAVAVASFAFIPPNEMLFFFLCAFAAGLFQIGGNIGFQSLAGQYYTTSIRGSAIGWAFAIGNIGSVVGPAAGGLLLGANVPLDVIFILSATPLVVVAVCVALLTRTRQSRKLAPIREG